MVKKVGLVTILPSVNGAIFIVKLFPNVGGTVYVYDFTKRQWGSIYMPVALRGHGNIMKSRVRACVSVCVNESVSA